MKIFLLIPLLAAALLFSGCEATVVDGRPYHRQAYGYGHRNYYDSDRGRDYGYRTSRDDRYYHRSDSSYRQGYVSTRPVYSTPQYSRTREIHRTPIISPRSHGQRTVVKVEAPAHKRSKKKDNGHDRR